MATVTPGMEAVAESEVMQTIRGAWPYGVFRGRILFGCTAPLDNVLQLRCVDNIYAHIAWFRVGHTRHDLQELHRIVLGTDLASALAHFSLPPTPSAVVNASRSGHQTYSRFEAAEAVMRALAEGHGLRRGTVERHDLGFRLDIVDDNALLSVKLTSPSFRFRGERRKFGPGALRPPVAHALVRLSEPRDDEVFLDPFCGSGTIAAERAFYTATRIVAIDIDPDILALTRQNVPECVEVLAGDACHLPFDAQSVDTIVTNPPWGAQVGNKADLPRLYLDFLRESQRVLSQTGRLIMLTDQEPLVHDAVCDLGLKCKTLCTISLHGRLPSVYVIRH